MQNRTIVILDNIRSAHNVGSIFRTADGAGAEKIYLVGTTPAPRDRFGRVVPEIQKTSLGASEFVGWEEVADEYIDALVKRLRDDGYMLVVVEQASDSISLHDFVPSKRVAYVFGNEVDGVGPTWLRAADTIIEIPMRGQKESLNVSVAAGIVLFKNG